MLEAMERSRSFGQVAEVYERVRPGYPEAALDYLLAPAGGRRVLDLGAGTGKLTRQLTARGLDVVAVEPTDGMRDQLAAAVPHAEVLAGDAEHIPLADESVDAVLVAQAWHWFDQERAPLEVARVLRPGGVLGVTWNLRDDAEPWVDRMSSILWDGGDSTKHAGERPPALGPRFGAVQERRFGHAVAIDAEILRDLVRSRSYFIVAPPDEQAEIMGGIDELVRTHPDLAGRASFDLPYVTVAYRAIRRP